MRWARIATRSFGIGPETSLVTTVPPQHMYGLEWSVLVPLAVGAAVDAGRPFFPEDVRRTLARVPAPRALITTPVHLAACVGARLDWPVIDFVVSATAPLSAELASEVEVCLRTRVFEIYGCTEAGSMASRRTCAGPEWRWLDTVRSRTTAGDTVIEADFLAAPVPLADTLECGHDGRFLLHGRRRDLVKVAGKRASLHDLNLKLASVPGVRDGVFVVPEGHTDEVGRLAAVVAAPGLDRADLLRALRRLIDPAFLPRPLLFVDALPRNPAGKIPRQRLLDLIQSATGSRLPHPDDP